MIPSIEAIVEGLLDGSIDKSQAVTWLHIWAEGAASEMRDHFAGQALTGMVAGGDWIDTTFRENVSKNAYAIADAMLAEREKANG